MARPSELASLVAELDFRERAKVSSFAVHKADHTFRVARENQAARAADATRGVGKGSLPRG
jgi:hypothetical protein